MLLDSNIIIYAINSSSPKHKKAQEFIQKNAKDLSAAYQNIFESIRVLTHPKFSNPMTPIKAMDSVYSIVSKLQILSPTFETHAIAFELITKYKVSSDAVFDAYLVATMLSNGEKMIVTDNVRDFEKIESIEVIRL